MTPYKARAIVLNTIKYGDSSLIVHLYTDLWGRQNYMLQGIKTRGKSNKISLLQPLFLVDLIGYEPKYGDLHKIKELVLSHPLISIPFDIKKSAISLFLAETIYRLIRETHTDEALFDFMYDSIVAFDKMEEGIFNFHLWFIVKLTFFIGIYPGNSYEKNSYFDITTGLFTLYSPSHQMILGQEDAKLLGRLMDTSVSELNEIKISGKERSAFLNSLLIFIGYHTDSVNNIKSLDIFKEFF